MITNAYLILTVCIQTAMLAISFPFILQCVYISNKLLETEKTPEKLLGNAFFIKIINLKVQIIRAAISLDVNFI